METGSAIGIETWVLVAVATWSLLFAFSWAYNRYVDLSAEERSNEGYTAWLVALGVAVTVAASYPMLATFMGSATAAALAPTGMALAVTALLFGSFVASGFMMLKGDKDRSIRRLRAREARLEKIEEERVLGIVLRAMRDTIRQVVAEQHVGEQ